MEKSQSFVYAIYALSTCNVLDVYACIALPYGEAMLLLIKVLVIGHRMQLHLIRIMWHIGLNFILTT